MHFQVIGEIERVETIAVGGGIRDIMRLQRQSGPGRWRKLKGVARVRFAGGGIRLAGSGDTIRDYSRSTRRAGLSPLVARTGRRAESQPPPELGFRQGL